MKKTSLDILPSQWFEVGFYLLLFLIGNYCLYDFYNFPVNNITIINFIKFILCICAILYYGFIIYLLIALTIELFKKLLNKCDEEWEKANKHKLK